MVGDCCFCSVLLYSIKLITVPVNGSDIYQIIFLFFSFLVGEDEADNPLPSNDMLTPPVLRCYSLYSNE